MKKKTGFEKFFTEKKGAAKREAIRQEKRKWKKERNEKAEERKRQVAEPGRPKIERAVEEQMPLNKYIAHSGVCSRRDAAELVKSGKVKVNGEVVTDPGHKVTAKDAVVVGNKKVHPVKDLVYIL